MSDYEIFGYVSSRSQPSFDEAVVVDATDADLDWQLVSLYFADLREARPRASYLRQSDLDAARQLRILKDLEGALRPTLAGLLVFGKYPQAVEPQLVITFLHYYGTDENEPAPRGERFLDNRKFDGPVPRMVDEAVAYIMASVRKSSLIDGLLRRDIPEYPEEAVREAIVNAVVHRDYSDYVRGSYIQVRLFADRLEVQSPGGLYGNVTEETLDEEQSTRNRLLARFMEDLRLMENRGSGIGAMTAAMRQLNLEPPRFSDKRSSFWVTFRNHTLMNPTTIRWLSQFAHLRITDRQRLALAYLRGAERITNGDYRRLNRVDTLAASRELRQLVQMGLMVQQGVTRGSYYSLGAAEQAGLAVDGDERASAIVQHVRVYGAIANSECRALLGLNVEQASRLLAGMTKAGLLRREGKRRWARYVLP
jgi:ATP-dependent DNA helicase RecG